MSNPNTVLSVEDTMIRQFQLDVNDLYEYPATRTVKALATCPDASEVRIVKAPKSSGGQFVFDTNLGNKQFLSNVFLVRYSLPFKVTLKTAVPGEDAIDPSNFIKKFFENNDDICLSQQAMAQAEDFSAITLNGQTLNPITMTPAMTNIISPYYNVDDVNEYLQASQPDRFQSFEEYNATAGQTLKFIDEFGRDSYTTISPLNEQNIFASKYERGYSTRTPQWRFLSVSADKKTVNVACTFWSYNRFNIGATPNNESSISGVERFGLTVRLANDLGSKLFNIKKFGAVSRYASIELDSGNHDNTEAYLCLKMVTPPEYMMKQSIDEVTGKMKPYQISYPRVDCKQFDAIETVTPGTSKKFNRDGIQLGSIPRAVYIAILKDREGDFEKVTQTPVNFGLITNLNVSINSLITSFPDQISLDYVTNSNGYDEMDPLGKLIKGYPIKLNFGKDITVPKNVVVGAEGIFNFSVSGQFINQGAAASTYRLYTVFVYDDYLDFDGTRFSQSSGVYVPASLLSSEYFLRDLFHNQQKMINTIGGGKFGDAMKWLGKNAISLAKNAWENRDKIASTVGDVMSLVKTVKGGKLAQYNVSGAGPLGTHTLGAGYETRGAGSVKSRVFK